MTKTTVPKKDWTFMVYMAGDNDLDPNGVQDLKEMKKVGSTKDINIIAQFDRAAGHKAKRYYLRKGGTVNADAVVTLGKANMGDPKLLTEFFQWGVKNYPADRYILVLWNHGQGWDDTDIFAGERHRAMRRLPTGRVRHSLFHTPVRRMLKRAIHDTEARAILIDDDAKDFLDNLEMKKVVSGAAKLLKRKLDILGMDACLMSMVEVGYQLRVGAMFTVGSEETEPLDGWPYDTILAELAKKPEMNAKDLSTLIVNKYLASYDRDSVTQSACDLSKADALANAVTGLASALKAKLGDTTVKQAILTARAQSQAYDVPDNIDLVDFCSLLQQAAVESTITDRCKEVISAATHGYLVAQGFKGAGLKDSHGVAIYFPTVAVSPLYAALDFSLKTGWDGFLKAYLTAVRSRP
jgi:hypothetical protein